MMLRIGTRGSPLALVQAHDVRRRLMAARGLAEDQVEIVVITTSGDRIQDRALAQIGGKGLFTKEIEEALFENRVDLAVHSMKDMETKLPDGLTIGAVLEREDVRDAFISLRHGSLDALPRGAVVGTSSLRRRAQLKHLRPDVEVVEFRGNVDTRLRKLADGVAEATFLACAGLNRLGMADRVTAAVPVASMLPAVAQAAVAIEIRAGDERTAGALAPLNHEATTLCVTAERAFLARLDGSCRTPVAANATLSGGRMHLTGEILMPDGSKAWRGERQGGAAEALKFAVDLADELLAAAGPGYATAVAAALMPPGGRG